MLIKFFENIYNISNFKKIDVEDDVITVEFPDIIHDIEGEEMNYTCCISIEDQDIFYEMQNKYNYDHKDMRWIKTNVAWKIYDMIWTALCDKKDYLNITDVFENMCNDAQKEYEIWCNED